MREGNKMEKLLLTPEETAEALNIGRSTVFEMLRRRELESVKIGKARRIPVEVVRDYVDRLKSDAA